MAVNDANVKRFEEDLRKLSKRLHIDFKLLLKKVAFDIFTGVVKKTPFLTGMARSSWNINVGTPDDTPPNKEAFKKVKDSATGARAAKIAYSKLSGFNINDKNPYSLIYITSPLVYMEYLEEGSSKKAGNGMVKVTLEEISSALR